MGRAEALRFRENFSEYGSAPGPNPGLTVQNSVIFGCFYGIFAINFCSTRLQQQLAGQIEFPTELPARHFIDGENMNPYYPLPLAAMIMSLLASSVCFADSPAPPMARPSARPPIMTAMADVASRGSIDASISILSAKTPYIIGGELVPARNTIATSTVALVMVGSGAEAGQVSLCSGSLLTSDMIVTAAHCVFDRPSSVHIVFSNALSSESVKSSIEASGYLANPAYHPQKMGIDQNDIAVVYFHGGLPKGYEAAHILPASSPLQAGESTILAGYGITNAMTHQGAGTLRETDVEISNPSLGKTEAVLDQTKGHGACHGDSGGPAFIRTGTVDYLWGVTSRGYPNTAPDDCAHDVVYTKIDAHLDFLQAAARQAR